MNLTTRSADLYFYTMETQEIWKDVKGYEGHYQVSNYGNVRSIKFCKIKILKPSNINGYLMVPLYLDGEKKREMVHRLVYSTFVEDIPNFIAIKGMDPQKQLVINHKDENKSNNRLENLELISMLENSHYGTSLVRQKYKWEENSKKVYQYTLNLQLVRIWKSLMVCKKNGYSAGNICDCCKNKYMGYTNVYKNFVWSYEPLNKHTPVILTKRLMKSYIKK